MGLTLAAGVAGASVGVFGAGPAAADPVSLELRYVCSVQMLPDRAGTVEIDSDVPTSAVVGKPTSKFVIHAAVPVNAADAKGLRSAGIKVIKGTVDAKVRVTAPGGDTNLKVPFHVARTDVPDSGPFSVEATGVAPKLTFSRSGRAKITVGDLIAHVTASGGMTVRLDVPCKLDSGQNNVVASLDITGTRTTTGPTPSKVPVAATSGTTGSPNPSEGARAGATAEGSAGPSGGLATTGSQGVMSLIPLVAGTVVLGALAVAAAFRFRSRAR
ncbi:MULTISPECIES: DUF6801 domain-containing protein [unclassified Streptomyces]|uniref:DUF6801 domain-containing protein n=1 Tax=unclassified Streptomyces TaxID=2593676 RepID=UPI000938C12E|nr:DUF6801 domain-containing protein [Streptomyces sp. TSRI0281]OKI40307.1 hypothetical protein A6A29_39390 [Streptomyces sp. TSRI0281]